MVFLLFRRNKKGSPDSVPKYMLDIWNDEHEKMIEEFAEVKARIDLYQNK